VTDQQRFRRLLDANVTVKNFAEFRLVSAVKSNLLADVLNAPWNLNRSSDGQVEDRAFRIYVRGGQVVGRLMWLLNFQMRRVMKESEKQVESFKILTFSHPSVVCMNFCFRVTSDSNVVIILDTVSCQQTTVVDFTVLFKLERKRN
jgi:hypothetical protein